MEIWDGYYKDGRPAGIDLVRGGERIKNLFHLTCEVLVRHADGDYLLMKRSLQKDAYPGFYEATAGGAAQKGEDAIACIKRELREKTGLECEEFQEIAFNAFDKSGTLCHSFVCTVNCDKDSVKLQEGETEGFMWLSESEFIEFLASELVINTQKERYIEFFKKMGYVN